jgi:hypothetical protein
MRNIDDVYRALDLALREWHPKQCRALHEDYYLYYLPTSAEHDGCFLFLKEDPANKEFICTGQVVSKHLTIEANRAILADLLRVLPILALSSEDRQQLKRQTAYLDKERAFHCLPQEEPA